MPFHCQTVDYRRAAVETRVVVVHLARVGKLVGIAALPVYRHRRHILHYKAVGRLPRQFEHGSSRCLLVAGFAVVKVAEKAVGVVDRNVAAHSERPRWPAVVRH